MSKVLLDFDHLDLSRTSTEVNHEQLQRLGHSTLLALWTTGSTNPGSTALDPALV
jgi:hypothetical protein